MKRIAWTFGLIAGAVLAAMLLLTAALRDHISFDKAELIGYTSMVAAFLMVFFGIKSYRDTVLNGSIRFGQAVRAGMLITAVSCLCYMATWEVLYYQVYPDFGTRYAEAAVAKAKANGASEEQLARTRAQMAKYQEMYKNPFINAAITIVEPLPVGLLVTLVSAGVLARKRGRVGKPVVRVA